jgi:hypothetical protein
MLLLETTIVEVVREVAAHSNELMLVEHAEGGECLSLQLHPHALVCANRGHQMEVQEFQLLFHEYDDLGP